MKTRVKYYSGWYYPQVKKLIFWKHIIDGSNYAAFKTLDEAVEFISLGNWVYNDKVMWSSK